MQTKTETSEIKAELVKEMYRTSDKKEIEQVAGMRELFLGLISQNKREYDTQLTDMKIVFSSLLKETQNAFQDQVQMLSVNLSKISAHQLQLHKPEPLDPKIARSQSEFDEFSRVNALKEVLLGENLHHINAEIVNLRTELDAYYKESQEAIEQFSQEFEIGIKLLEQNMLEDVQQLIDKIQQALNEWNARAAQRQFVSQLFTHIADQLPKTQ